MGELGYRYDEATGRHNLRRRDYESQIAQFLSEDPPEGDDDTNRYRYVRGNPTNAVDPSGKNPCRALLNSITRTEADISAQRDKISELEYRRRALVRRLEKLDAEDRQAGRFSTSQAEVDAIKAQLDKAKADEATSRDRLASLMQQQEEIQARREAARAAHDRAVAAYQAALPLPAPIKRQMKFGELAKAKNETQRKLNEVESELVALSAAMGDERKRLKQLGEQIQFLRAELDRVTQLAAASTDEQKRRDAERAAIRAEIAEIDRSLAEAKRTFAATEKSKDDARFAFGNLCKPKEIIDKCGYRVGVHDPLTDTVTREYDCGTYTLPYDTVRKIIDAGGGYIDWRFLFTGELPKTVLGDEALDWNFAQKFLEAARLALKNGCVADELRAEYQQILDTLTNPEAVARFLLFAAATAGVKKATCNTRLGPVAGAAITIGEIGQLACQGIEIERSLSGITFKSECNNASRVIARAIIDAIKTFGIGWLLKKIPCFAAGTQVVVPGSDDADPACGPYATKSIERFQAGDRVLAWDAAAGRLVFDRVTRSLTGACDHLRLVTFEDVQGRRQTLRTTDRHPFWFPATGEWICAADLRPGMLCQGPNGEPLTVAATTREDHPTGVAVYNLTVDPSHNYFVQETTNPTTPILVHNAKKGTKGVDDCGESSGRNAPHAPTRTPIQPTVTRDRSGRITSSGATIRPENLHGGTGTTDAARALTTPDDAGHIIGRLLGGQGGATSGNIFPQLPSINRGAFRDHEAWIASMVREGKSVQVRVELIYPNKSTTRPSRVVYYTTVDGVTTKTTFSN